MVCYAVLPSDGGEERRLLVVPRAKTVIVLELASSPVLHAPDITRPFTLQTDASDTGLGAVLSQTREEHPIVYISRKLSRPET